MANIKRYTEKELLEGLYSKGAHADEIAQVSEAEFAGDPLSELAGSVKRFVRPTDPVGEDDWEANS